jgi:hypothetical protein
MKEISQSIIKSTKSLLGRLTTVTTMGCMLALVFLVAASPQPQTSGKARPFKLTGIFTSPNDGTFRIVGTATHLGKFVAKGTIEFTSMSPDGMKLFMRGAATWTAANGDNIQIDLPEWVADYSVTPPTSTGVANIIGGTGRFVNASGSFFSEISPADSAPGVTQIITGEGTISY